LTWRATSARPYIEALALALSRRGMAKKITLIAKARVPIVKFEAWPGGYHSPLHRTTGY
jgi:non-canonical poly(A) RNA polymerase PAPD5/7